MPQLSRPEFASPARKAPSRQQIPALSTQPGEAETFPTASPKRDSFPTWAGQEGGLAATAQSGMCIYCPGTTRQHSRNALPNISPRAARGNPEPWEHPQPLTHPSPCCSCPLNGPKLGKTSGLCAPQLGLPGLPDIPITVPVFAPIPVQRRARAFLFFLAFSP